MKTDKLLIVRIIMLVLYIGAAIVMLWLDDKIMSIWFMVMALYWKD